LKWQTLALQFVVDIAKLRLYVKVRFEIIAEIENTGRDDLLHLLQNLKNQ
jgi:hypothetical protein